MKYPVICMVFLASLFPSYSAQAFVDKEKITLARSNAAFTVQSLINNHCSKWQQEFHLDVGECEKTLASERIVSAYTQYYLNTFSKDELDVFVNTKVLLSQPNYSQEKMNKLLKSYQRKNFEHKAEIDSLFNLTMMTVKYSS